MENFHELVKHRRSIRKFEEREVPREELEAILQTALMAPASKRANGWEFLVVTDKNKLTTLAECRPFGSKFLANAPAAIVVLYNHEKSDVWVEDASIAAIILQLAAADRGLGSCWVQVRQRMHNDDTTAEDFVRQTLHIPEQLNVLNIVAVGYPNEERKPYDESKLGYEKIHWENYE